VDSIYELARRAGVAPSTVSKALRNDPRISVATRARVQALASEAGFTVNAAAQSLTTRRTLTIGLIVPDYADPYNGLLLRGIETAAVTAGYQLLVASAHEAGPREVDIARTFRQRRVDGMIIVASHVSESHEHLDPRIPVVLVAEKPALVPDRPLASCLIVDDEAGARTMTQHLLNLGHRRIGYVAIGRASLASDARRAGYEDALRQAGLEPDARLVAVPNRRDMAGVGAEGVQLLLPHRPTAIFFYNDLAAIGGLRAVLDRGLRVPEQISIAGFDDLEIAQLVTPPLTTMAQPRLDMGRMAAERLLAMIGGDDDRTPMTATCTLMVRRSTAPSPD
jgi:LacI family transcriptional regulator/LacI family repressor for deo operon, udp, cdd, tsx, nupC, and nupG